MVEYKEKFDEYQKKANKQRYLLEEKLIQELANDKIMLSIHLHYEDKIVISIGSKADCKFYNDIEFDLNVTCDEIARKLKRICNG